MGKLLLILLSFKYKSIDISSENQENTNNSLINSNKFEIEKKLNPMDSFQLILVIVFSITIFILLIINIFDNMISFFQKRNANAEKNFEKLFNQKYKNLKNNNKVLSLFEKIIEKKSINILQNIIIKNYNRQLSNNIKKIFINSQDEETIIIIINFIINEHILINSSYKISIMSNNFYNFIITFNKNLEKESEYIKENLEKESEYIKENLENKIINFFILFFNKLEDHSNCNTDIKNEIINIENFIKNEDNIKKIFNSVKNMKGEKMQNIEKEDNTPYSFLEKLLN